MTSSNEKPSYKSETNYDGFQPNSSNLPINIRGNSPNANSQNPVTPPRPPIGGTGESSSAENNVNT